MSAILDILIVVIIGVTIGFAVKNGFVKTVLSAASFLIALAVAFLFVAPVRDAFLESGMAVKVRTAVDESITSFVTDTSEEQEELPEFLTKLEFIGIDKDELQTKWNDWRSGNTETLKNELVGYVSEPVLRAVATFTAFILLYLGSVLVLRLAAPIRSGWTSSPASTRRRPSCSNSFTKTISSISSLPEPADAPSGGTRFPRRAAQTLD